MSQLSQNGAVSGLLRAWGRGDVQARDDLVPLIYRELKRRAGAYLRRERRDHTLQPTALVHEAFIRLIGDERVEWQSRAHFFGIAANIMRRILVDHARGHQAAKRQGAEFRVALDDNVGSMPPADCELLSLDMALDELATRDARQARIVELRYFGGLSEQEVAAALSLSRATVTREWQSARTWLYRRMTVGLADGRRHLAQCGCEWQPATSSNQADGCGAGIVHERVQQKLLPVGRYDVLCSEDRRRDGANAGGEKPKGCVNRHGLAPARGSDADSHQRSVERYVKQFFPICPPPRLGSTLRRNLHGFTRRPKRLHEHLGWAGDVRLVGDPLAVG